MRLINAEWAVSSAPYQLEPLQINAVTASESLSVRHALETGLHAIAKKGTAEKRYVLVNPGIASLCVYVSLETYTHVGLSSFQYT